MEFDIELIRQRHSVRQYADKPIPQQIRSQLNEYAEKLNREGDLNMQIIYDEPQCFNSRLAHYGHFENVKNYIAVVGRKSDDLDQRCGYYGELLVLKAQQLGLNTCWVALTHGKSQAVIAEDEKEVIIISLGYGANQGNPHKSRRPDAVSDIDSDSPQWFKNGIEAALLAPTAVNQQKFHFSRNGDVVTVKAGLIGSCLKIDLGIVRCHFEIGAGRENFRWG